MTRALISAMIVFVSFTDAQLVQYGQPYFNQGNGLKQLMLLNINYGKALYPRPIGFQPNHFIGGQPTFAYLTSQESQQSSVPNYYNSRGSDVMKKVVSQIFTSVPEYIKPGQCPHPLVPLGSSLRSKRELNPGGFISSSGKRFVRGRLYPPPPVI